MAKVRTSICIDGDVLQMGQAAAHDDRVSFSRFIEDAIRDRVHMGVLGICDKHAIKRDRARRAACSPAGPDQVGIGAEKLAKLKGGFSSLIQSEAHGIQDKKEGFRCF